MIFTTGMALISHFYLGQAKNISPFTDLKVYDKINVELIPSNSYKAEISGSKADDVQLSSSGNELKIKMKTLQVLQGDDVKVTVYYKNIDNIQASQGAKVVSGDALKSAKLIVISNEGSFIDLSVDTKVLEAKINTGGSLKLSGNSDSQSVIVNTGGQYDGQNLKTQITSITTNAGGQASVYATQSVDATTRAGGNIDVYGNPKSKNDKNVIGGKVNYH